MEDFSKLLEIVQALIKIFNENKILKISAYSFMSFLSVFLLEQIFSVYIILTPMNTTIKAVSVLGIIISASVMFSYVVVNAAEKVLLKIRNKILSEREREALIKSEIARNEATRKILDGLRVKEKAIIKYMLKHDGLVWLPCENIYVLSLLQKGYLRAVNGLSTLRGLNSYYCAQCFGCIFSSNIDEYISGHKEEIFNAWEEISEIKDFDGYQEY